MFQITSGVIAKAQKVVIYGPEGVGKSTLASKFPHPIFIDTEGSTANLDVKRLPAPSSWEMLLEEIEYIKKNPLWDTLVIDTADWAEKLAIQLICMRHHVDGIEGIRYGKGYVYLEEEFGRLLNKLSELIDIGINVVLLAHAQIKKFEQPDELGAYDRWELKLQKKTAPLVKEWADMLLFANYKTVVVNVDNQGAIKGKNKGQGQRRTLFTEHTAVWDAKNRHQLPFEMEMDFKSLAHIFTKNNREEDDPFAGIAFSPNHKQEKQEKREIEEVERGEVREIEEIRKIENMEPIELEEVKDKKLINEVASSFEGRSTELVSNKALNDLLLANQVSVDELCSVVEAQGYYSKGTSINAYDPGFIEGVLVGAWSQVYKKILEQRGQEYGNGQLF